MGAKITKELERELVLSPRPSVCSATKSIKNREYEHHPYMYASSDATSELGVDQTCQQSDRPPLLTKRTATPMDLVHVLLSEDIVEVVLLFLHPWDISAFLGTNKENSKMACDIWKVMLRGLMDEYVEIVDNASVRHWKIEAYKAYRRKNLQRPVIKTNKDDVNEHFDEYSPFKSIFCTMGKRRVQLQGLKPIALGRGSYRLLWRVYPITRNCRLTFTAYDAKKDVMIHTFFFTPKENHTEPPIRLLDRLGFGSPNAQNDNVEDKPMAREVIDCFGWRIMSSGNPIEVPAEGMDIVAKLDIFGICLVDYFEIQVIPQAGATEEEEEEEEEEEAKGIGVVAVDLFKSPNPVRFSRAA